jgi:phosphate transport system substrate-binding protein
MFKSITFYIPALIVLLLFSGCGRRSNNQANSLQIKGSDTMVNLGQAWAEEYMKLNPGTSIAVTGG